MQREKRTLKADVCILEINLLSFWINRGRRTQEGCDKGEGKSKDCLKYKNRKVVV